MRRRYYKLLYVALCSIMIFGINLWGRKCEIQEWNSLKEVTVLVKCESYYIPTHLYQEDGQYKIYIPSFASLRKCKIVFPQNMTLIIDGKKIRNGKKLAFLKENELYEYQCLDKDKNNIIANGSLMVMKSENVSTLYIDIENEDLLSKHEPISGNLVMIGSEGDLRYKDALEGITIRGNSTASDGKWGGYKKPYHITLQRKVELLGHNIKSRNWVLLANGCRDKTYISNALLYDLANKLKLPYSPKSEFCDVYINGEYKGNYLLCKKTTFPGQYTNLEKENQQVNADIDLTDCEKYDDGENKGFIFEKIPEDITGSYLIDVTTHDAPSRFHIDLGPEYIKSCGIANPEYADAREVVYIAELMRGMVRAITSEDGYDSTTGKYYLDYIDLDSFADLYLFNEISKNYDAGTGSSYYYKLPDSVSTKLYAGPIWDFDGAFANEISNGTGRQGTPYGVDTLTLRHPEYNWFSCLYQKDEFYQCIADKYERVYYDAFKEIYEKKIDRYRDNIRKSVLMDLDRYQLDTDWEEEIDYLKWFVKERTEYLYDVWCKDLYEKEEIYSDTEATKYIYHKK